MILAIIEVSTNRHTISLQCPRAAAVGSILSKHAVQAVQVWNHPNLSVLKYFRRLLLECTFDTIQRKSRVDVTAGKELTENT